MLRAVRRGMISFGLVNIPVQLYTAASSKNVSFHLLHEKCGSRISQQIYCPHCKLVVDRDELVKGYEVADDRYVQLTADDFEKLEDDSSESMNIVEFVPLSTIDPIYYEKTYYLGPGEGGDKTYHLLAQAMAKTEEAALAQFVMYGKENLVLIRSAREGLLLHVMYYADEVHNFAEVDMGKYAKASPAEIELATRLIVDLKKKAFRPGAYRDKYRERVLRLIRQKQSGKKSAAAPPRAGRKPSDVIDLMAVLKASIAKGAPKKRSLSRKGTNPLREAVGG